MKKAIILSVLFYLQQSYAIAPKDLSPEDLQWYKDKVIDTHKTLDDQAKKDIEEGLGNKKNHNNSTHKCHKKTKDPKKAKKAKKAKKVRKSHKIMKGA
ncbi:MAG: hypothetical protein QS721_10130 [Candidatus Endonucleobacter sp. (ex Gigantidas childressi)]|nr:hypothetical protein [Candidatus Endonucleobacter sp. (ex Gigantidas childressi)]